MSCPRCGAGGRVPRDRVNSRLVCKKCLQVFHLNATLQAVMGEPPSQKAGARGKTERDGSGRQTATRERAQLELPGLEGLSEKLSKIKLPDAQTLGITAAVLLAVAFFWWLFSKPSIEQRAHTLVSAIRKFDVDKAVEMALPGTEMETMKWVGDVYKEYLDIKLNIGNLDPGDSISVTENSDGSAQSLIVFSREGATSSGPLSVEDAASLEPQNARAKKSMEMVVFWGKDTWGIWRLDGQRTVENASRPH